MSNLDYTITERTRSYCAGASVLCYAVDPRTREPLLLLGQDSHGEHKWSDFGGGAQRRESSWACAARELHEETHGLFAHQVTPEYLRNQSRATFKFPSKKNRNKVLHYATFLVRVPHRRQPEEFQYRRTMLSPKELTLDCRTEKARLHFVPLTKINDLQLRSFFRQRLQHIAPCLLDCAFTVPSFTVVLGQRRLTPPSKTPFRERQKQLTKGQQEIVDSMLETYTPATITAQ